MSILQAELEDAIAVRDLVELHRDELEARTLVGRVEAADGLIVLTEVDSDGGDYDGLSVLVRDDVTRLRRRSARLRAETASVKLPEPSLDVQRLSRGTLCEAASKLSSAFGYVIVHCEAQRDSTFAGRVRQADGDYLLLDGFGPPDETGAREIVLAAQLVSSVQADSRHGRSLLQRKARAK